VSSHVADTARASGSSDKSRARSPSVIPRQEHSPDAVVDQIGGEFPSAASRGVADFSLLESRSLPRNVRDDDPARATITRLLIEELAPLLGIDPQRIVVHADAGALSRLGPRRAAGLQDQGEVFLHPQHYRPQDDSGRYLLAHELTHAAQRRVDGHSNPNDDGLRPAEHEADLVARAFVRRQALPRPSVSLGSTVAAEFSGDPSNAIAALGTEEQHAGPSLDAQRKELDGLVAQTRTSELARMIDLLSYGLFDWAVTDGDVTEVLRILMTLNMVGARSLVAALPLKYRHRLLDNLDTDHYKHHRAEVLAVYWGSSPEELKPFSGELRKAFETMDLRGLASIEAAAAQYALKNIDEAAVRALRDSKHRDEIETILAFVPDEREEARLLEEQLQQDTSVRAERAAAQKAYTTGPHANVLAALVRQIAVQVGDSQFSTQRAMNVLEKLLPFANLKVELRAIADHLAGVRIIPNDNPGDKPEYEERFDYLDRLIRFVRVDDLYGDSRMQRMFFLLLTFRPAYKNSQLAEELTNDSRFILVSLLMKALVDPFTDRVTSEDAYLAFLLVKAMPASSRKAFFSIEGGDRWKLVMDRLSQQQRESEALNLYSGGAGDSDRNALLAQLLADDVWKPEATARLDGLIRMAIAAGEHEFVFTLSKQRNAYATDWLKPYVDKYRLFDPKAGGAGGRPRTEYSPELLEGTAWYTRGYLFGGVYKAGQGLDFIFSSKNVEVATKSVGGEGLNLVELQDLFGGNFMGVRFKELSELGQEGETARKSKRGVNFANVKWDTGLGLLTMDTPKLEIEAIRYPVEDFEFQSARGTIQGMNLALRYPNGARPEPSSIDVKIDQLILHDVALVSPNSMKSANQLDVTGVQVHAGTPAADSGKQQSPRGGLKIPIRLVGVPLGGAWNLFLGSMWNSLLGLFKVQSRAGVSGSVAELASLLDAAGPTGFRFSFGSVNMLGLTTSGGQYIESVNFTDVVVQGGGDAGSYRLALNRSIERIDERLAGLRESFGRSEAAQRNEMARSIRSLQTQRDHTREELDKLTATERDVARLEAMQAKSPASFGTQERLQLRRLKAQLSGAVLDIGHVGIKGLAGVGKGDFTMENVHGDGRSVNSALSLLTNSDRLKSFITGAEGRPVLASGDKNGDLFTLDIGHVELPPLTLKAAIPTAEAATKDFERFKTSYEPWRQTHRDEFARLEQRKDLARQREDLLADPGISSMSEPQQRQFRGIERRLEELEAKAALIVGRVVMDGARLGIAGNERISVGADALLVENLRQGDMHVAKIEGTNVVIGVDVHDGIAGLDEWRKNLARIGIKGESVVASDITNDEIGLTVDRATLMGIDEASLDVGTRNASARLTTKLVLVEGVRLHNMEGMLVNERDYLAGLTSRTTKQQSQLDSTLAALAALAGLRKQVSDAEVALAKAAKPKEKESAQRRRDSAQHELDRWAEGMVARSLAVNDLDVDVTGLGDVLSSSFDPAGALDGGVHVRGRGGPGHKRIFSGATGVDVAIPGLSGSRIGLGETGGEVTVSEAGAKLDGIHIDSIAAQGFEWHDGQRRAFSRGETRLQGIDVTAFIGDRQILVSRLECAAVTAEQLGYEDQSTGLSAVVESGGLGGVSITNLTVDLPQKQDGRTDRTDTKIAAGKIVAASANDLRINTLIAGISARGTLNGSNLSVEFLTDRKRVIRVGDLRLGAGEIAQPGRSNNIHVSFSGLKGSITQETLDSGQTQYNFDGIGLGDLTIGKSLWAGSGWRIEIAGHASLHGVTLDAVALQEKKNADGAAGKLSQFTLTDVRVAQIKASDVHVRVDAVAPDPKKPHDEGTTARTFDLAEATILDLAITGIDLTKKLKGMTGKIEVRNSIDVQKLRIAVGDAGKDQIVTTVSVKAFGTQAKDEGLRGRELSAQLFGPGGQKINVGTIQKAGGDFEGFGAKTAFATGRITMSPIEISGDGKEAKVSDVTVESIHLDAPAYSDGKGTEVKLAGANARNIHIEGVVAKFGEVTDAAGKKSQGMTNLDISGLRFEFIDATGFRYTGKTTLSSGDTKSRTVTADKAELADLKLDKLSRDFNTRITTLKNARLVKTSITGFGAVFAETISGKTTQTEITGNVKAGAMQAELTLTGTKALGGDWTSIDGLFELTDPKQGLGLTNVHIVHKEGAGGSLATTFDLGVASGKTGGFDLTGLKVHFAPNGSLFVAFDELAGKNLHMEAGDTKVDIDLASLKKAAIGMQGLAPEQAFDVLGATFEGLQLQGLKATYEVDRSGPGSTAPTGARSAPWKLDALNALDGTLALHAANVRIVGDVDVAVPIHGGVIQFKDVNGDDGYWPPGDIYFLVNEHQIWARHYTFNSDPLYESPHIPGVTPAVIKRWVGRDGQPQETIVSRGSLNLREFLEGTLNAPSSGGPSTPPKQLDATNTLDLSGTLQPGDDVLGTTKNNVTLSGRSAGKNRISISSATIGSRLTLSMPEFEASKSRFERLGKTGTTGQINANVTLAVTGLGSAPNAAGHLTFTVTLSVIDGRVRDIKFGDVSLASQAAMRALPAPPKEK
jgi:hypothetical protein